mmetsp:Transcript_8176/g.20918  ORF Transcript_8176/g.20918 Transcript_8176/m.20918 type:complete len:202 (-) Transcript_8176:588-1193(-)
MHRRGTARAARLRALGLRRIRPRPRDQRPRPRRPGRAAARREVQQLEYQQRRAARLPVLARGRLPEGRCVPHGHARCGRGALRRVPLPQRHVPAFCRRVASRTPRAGGADRGGGARCGAPGRERRLPDAHVRPAGRAVQRQVDPRKHARGNLLQVALGRRVDLVSSARAGAAESAAHLGDRDDPGDGHEGPLLADDRARRN